jgi:hypothetical protein
LEYLSSSFHAITASRSLRENVTPVRSAAIRAYCCVMVDAPCVFPPVTLFQAARITAEKSTPSLVQNVWSSAATMACLTTSFISSKERIVRFSVPSFAMGVLPSA